MNEPMPITDRFRVFIVALTLLNTILAAILSGLQVDANIRADQANRDSQYYAMLASNEVIRLVHQGTYDVKLLATTTQHAQQSLVMQITAFELEDAGENESAAALISQSEVEQARSDMGASLSVFYTDPRYAPTEPGGLPNQEAYVEDLRKAADDLVARQKTASDEYHKWDNKADAYITVLTVLALAFFLLGLAQSNVRVRYFFATFALAIMLLATTWTAFILIT